MLEYTITPLGAVKGCGFLPNKYSFCALEQLEEVINGKHFCKMLEMKKKVLDDLGEKISSICPILSL